MDMTQFTHKVLMLRPMSSGAGGFVRLMTRRGRIAAEIHAKGLKRGKIRAWLISGGENTELGRAAVCRGEALLHGELPPRALAAGNVQAIAILRDEEPFGPLLLALISGPETMTAARAACIALSKTLQEEAEGRGADEVVGDGPDGGSGADRQGQRVGGESPQSASQPANDDGYGRYADANAHPNQNANSQSGTGCLENRAEARWRGIESVMHDAPDDGSGADRQGQHVGGESPQGASVSENIDGYGRHADANAHPNANSQSDTGCLEKRAEARWRGIESVKQDALDDGSRADRQGQHVGGGNTQGASVSENIDGYGRHADTNAHPNSNANSQSDTGCLENRAEARWRDIESVKQDAPDDGSRADRQGQRVGGESPQSASASTTGSEKTAMQGMPAHASGRHAAISSNRALQAEAAVSSEADADHTMEMPSLAAPFHDSPHHIAPHSHPDAPYTPQKHRFSSVTGHFSPPVGRFGHAAPTSRRADTTCTPFTAAYRRPGRNTFTLRRQDIRQNGKKNTRPLPMEEIRQAMTAAGKLSHQPEGRKKPTAGKPELGEETLREAGLPAIDPLPYVAAQDGPARRDSRSGAEGPQSPLRDAEPAIDRYPREKTENRPAQTGGAFGSPAPQNLWQTATPIINGQSGDAPPDAAVQPCPARQPVDALPELLWPPQFQTVRDMFLRCPPSGRFRLPGWRFLRASTQEEEMWIGRQAVEGRVIRIAYIHPGPPEPESEYQPLTGTDGKPYRALVQRG